MSGELDTQIAGVRIPDSDDPVIRAGGNDAAIGADGDAINGGVCVRDDALLGRGGEVPDSQRLVRRSGNEARSIPAVAEGGNDAFVAAQGRDQGAGHRIPDLHGHVGGA